MRFTRTIIAGGFSIILCACSGEASLMAAGQPPIEASNQAALNTRDGMLMQPYAVRAPYATGDFQQETDSNEAHGKSGPVKDWRRSGWQFPYDPNPFTTEICSSDPCSPTLDQDSAQMVDEIYASGFSLGEVQEAEPGTNGAGQADTFPIYHASQSDPSYTVTCDKYGGCGGFLPSVIHIPDGARASIDSDHHASVIELWAGLEIDFFQFNDGGTGHGTTQPVSGGGSLSVGFAGVCKITALANKGRCPGSAVAAAVPVQPGVIDPREWINGRINHTVYVSIACPSSGYLWPAAASDGQCSTAPLDGERIWLDLTDKQISALPTYHWAKVLLHEMHRYGLMVVDSAGAGSVWNLYGIDNATLTIRGKAAPWSSFFTMVTNEGDRANLDYADNASHLAIPTTGITASNIHIVP